MNKMNMIDICIKCITEGLKPSEQRKLDKWLADSTENRKTYHELETIWQNADPPKMSGLDVDEKWFQLQNRLAVPQKTPSPLIGHRFRPVLAGALAMVVLVVGIFVFRTLLTPDLQTFTTHKNERASLTLSDGSQVILNSASVLKYPESFSDTVRRVTLRGQAFFNVMKGEKPFQIVTDNAVTTVLGTEFDIWARNQKTRVVVKEGSVRLHAKNHRAEQVVLSKDEMCQIVADALTGKEKVDADFLLGWLDGKLVFHRTPLIEVTEELERTYDVDIIVTDPSLKAETLTAVFEHLYLNEILDKVCTTMGMEWTFNKGQYELFKEVRKQ